jgi:DNA modification methylase
MENGVATGKKAETPNGLLAGCAWDIKLDLVAFWEQVERLMKDDHTPVIHFCNARFGFELYNSKPTWFRYDLVWNKLRGVSFLLANKMPMKSHENIYVFAKKGTNYYRKDAVVEGKEGYVRTQLTQKPENIYGVSKRVPRSQTDGHRCVLSVIDEYWCPVGKTRHPTQKPDTLYAWLIERYSKEGDTILDPTAGSFASVFTAKTLGRHGIGIEKDEAFYTKAKEQA